MNRRREIGIFLPVGGQQMMGGASARYDDLEAMTNEAERLGYDFVGVLDHLLFHHWECWTVMSALAATTSRIQIVSYVTCTGYRNPALLARMADTLDEISKGRLVLGLGAGDSNTEHREFGYPTDKLVSRFEEAVQIIRQLVKSGQLEGFNGEYYDVGDITFAPRGPSPTGSPILIGSLGGPRMLELTARHADIWTGSLPATGGTLAGFMEMKERLDEACARNGRDPRTIDRMAEVVVRAPGGSDSLWWDGYTVEGDLNSIGLELKSFFEHGADSLMLWLEPNSIDGIQRVAPALEIARQS